MAEPYPRPRHGRHRKARARSVAAITGVVAVAAASELITMVPAHAATSDDFARLRMCESGGNYQTNTGNGFYGAYQFDLQTWQGLGYSGLPSNASPATQDQAAERLQAARGWEPWPACSARLGLTGGGGGTVTPVTTTVTSTTHSESAVLQSAPAWGGTMFTTSMANQVREDVRRWQQQMVDRGWHLAVDGRYGPQSAAVCTAFEREKGLHVETPGIVGPQVWQAAFTAPVG